MVSRVSTIDPGANVRIEWVVVAPTIPVDHRVSEVTLAITSPTAPIILGEEPQVTRLMVSVAPGEPIIMEVAREKETIMMVPLMIEVAIEVLSASTGSLSSDVVGGTTMHVLVSMPSV